MVERKALVIYYNNEDILKKLNNVHIYYHSSKMNYAIIYVDSSNFDKLFNYLLNNPMVDEVSENVKDLVKF